PLSLPLFPYTTLFRSASFLCGFPFCAFGLLACLRGGACGQLAVLFLLAAAKLFGLLAFLGFPLLSATCFPRLATHRPSLSKDRRSEEHTSELQSLRHL